MGLSRDEAREIAAVALMLTISLRLLAGVFQVVDELDRGGSWRPALERFLAPVGSTIGILALALALLFVLSPPGSISMKASSFATALCGVVAVLGAISVVVGLSRGGSIPGRIWFTLINGAAAAVLGSAAFWILRNFESHR